MSAHRINLENDNWRAALTDFFVTEIQVTSEKRAAGLLLIRGFGRMGPYVVPYSVCLGDEDQYRYILVDTLRSVKCADMRIGAHQILHDMQRDEHKSIVAALSKNPTNEALRWAVGITTSAMDDFSATYRLRN